MEINTISPKAYKLLIDKLGFPEQHVIERTVNGVIDRYPKMLTDIDKVGEIVSDYKSANAVKGTLDACLAVDALYFTPNVRINELGEIDGIDPNTEFFVGKKEFKLFTKDPKVLEKFLTLNGDKIIRSGFVFQVQPYNLLFKPFVVHVLPSTNGKASSDVVDILHEVRKICKCRNVNIKSFAFDGDTAYQELHRVYYESYIRKAIKEHVLNLHHSSYIRVVSDFLHIIKRLRYRILSSIIHAGFASGKLAINVDQVRKVLKDTEDVVWVNEPYTKMHDKLPLKMFSILNMLKLFKELPQAFGFWFPISLSIHALSAPDVGYSIRKFLLETVFWFLVLYKECQDKSETTLRKKKYKCDLDLTFYTDSLLMEFTNTIFCNLQLMSIENFSFDRNSTTPLEHKFGNVRVRANDIHTIQNFLRIISMMQTVDQVRESDSKIRGRSNSFGVVVEDKESDDESWKETYFHYMPQTFARCVLAYSGFDVKSTGLVPNDDVLGKGINFLYEIVEDEPNKRRKKKEFLQMMLHLG